MANMMFAHFLPFTSANPYQTLLSQALKQEGVEVSSNYSLSELCQGPDTVINTIAHIHWARSAPRHPFKFFRWLQYCRRLDVVQRKTPFVLTAHNLTPHESVLPCADRWLSRRLVRKADRIICHSPSARNELITKLDGRVGNKIDIIPHGNYIGVYPNDISRSAARQRLDLSHNEVVFLLFGMLRLYKGPFDLIEAFKRMPQRNIRLVLAGRPIPKETEPLIRSAISSDSRIQIFPHFIENRDIQVYMNAADVAVFPYRKSLTSGALILAMSFGQACIAPRLPSTTDTIGTAGAFLYEPDAPNGLYSALQTALSSSHQLASMGKSNYQQALQLDWTQIGQATKRCYQDAIAQFRLRTSGGQHGLST